MEDYSSKLYFHYPYFMSGLMLLLFCISYIKENNSKSLRGIILPLILLVSFLFIQNLNVGFRVGTLYANIINVLWNIAPFTLLLINKKIRPGRKDLIEYICYFVYIQLSFCALNLIGFRIYGDLSEGFSDSLICGTFSRYNHMANYLATFFLILSHEYFNNKGICREKYYLLALLIGLLIVMSGSRVTFVLYFLTAFYFFCLYYGKKTVILSSIAIVMLFSTFIIGNDSFYGQNADEGTGLTRNLIGIIDLANSDDFSEGNTLSLSAFLVLTRFDSPLTGNGKVFRPDKFYIHPLNAEYDENVFRTDARLAFMLVEYGIIGLFLFAYLFITMFKVCRTNSNIHDNAFYWGAGLYFFLFSLTDNGFWDIVQFSVIFIYAFSKLDLNKRAIY